jgi:uncharacterized cupin superfamily protein
MKPSKCVIAAKSVEPRVGTGYPEPYRQPCLKREKRALGDQFGLTQFGVNLTTLPPGCWSSQRHWHDNEDELVYVVDGEITLIDDHGEHPMRPGDCAGFRAGVANGHHLVNKSGRPATYVEIGTRAREAKAYYPDADLQAVKVEAGPAKFLRKDGTPY